jgi:hypothetical protein
VLHERKPIDDLIVGREMAKILMCLSLKVMQKRPFVEEGRAPLEAD